MLQYTYTCIRQLTRTHIHMHTFTHADFERQFPPSDSGTSVRSQRTSHSSLLNGGLPPLDSPLQEDNEYSEDPILPPPPAFLGSERHGSTTFIGEVEPPSHIHSPRHTGTVSTHALQIQTHGYGLESETDTLCGQ